jgi:plasmid maintenance system antidote protein VapI
MTTGEMTQVTFDPLLIRELLLHQGRSFTWLAEVTGYNRSHVSRMMTGTLPISTNFARKAAEKMDVPVTFFTREQVTA